MPAFAIDYFLFVFVASLGVIQIAASIGQLNGILILKSPIVARLLSAALAVAVFVWFFATEDRNLNDNEGGLDANIQAVLFVLSASAAVLVTLGISSVFNARMNGSKRAQGDGLDALKDGNYITALLHSIRYWRKEWRTRTKPYFFG